MASKIEDIVAEGLRIWKIGDDASRTAKVDEVLEAVGYLDRARAAFTRLGDESGVATTAYAVGIVHRAGLDRRFYTRIPSDLKRANGTSVVFASVN